MVRFFGGSSRLIAQPVGLGFRAEDHLPPDDVALRAVVALLRLPLIDLQSARNFDFLALVEIACAGLGLGVKDLHGHENGLDVAPPVRVFAQPGVGGDFEFRHRGAGGQILQFRLVDDAACENDDIGIHGILLGESSESG